MNQPEKGMTTEEASTKKKSGHKNEEHFAELIGGMINAADHTRKQDVHDLKHGWRYSVKSGKKWQIFLYARSRLEENTIIKAIGNISSLLIECIDTLPSDRSKREENPAYYKELLKVPMEKLARELQNKQILEAFFKKAMFDGDGVDFLSVLPSSIDQTKTSIEEKTFYVFDAKEVVGRFCDGLEVVNSKARGRGQTDSQKVVFRAKINGREMNIGEIELRTDPQNYGRVKFWLESKKILSLLIDRIKEKTEYNKQVILHGKAKRIAGKK